MNFYKFLAVLQTIIIAAILFFILKVDYFGNVPIYESKSSISTSNHISNYVNGASSAELLNKFSYDKYINDRKRIDISVLLNDLKLLDSLYPDTKIQNKEVLSIANTDALYALERGIFKTYQPDQFILLLQWVEQFKYYESIDRENAILYSSIHNFWLDKMSNALAALSKDNSSLKYDFKFRFLQARFSEKKFYFGPKVTSMEKLLYNLIDSNWAHLFDASWNQASSLQKVLFFFIVLLTLYAYFLLFKKIVSSIKSR